MARIVVCKECGEEKPHYAKGLCKPCYMHQWREAHPEYGHEWYKAHREEDNERGRQWDETHREQRCGYSLKWKRANPDKDRENCRRYRARKNGATIEPVDEAMVFERDGYMCMYCGALHVSLTIDHIVALNNGGPHCEDNLVAACRSCNPSKRDRLLEEWLQTQPYSIAWLL